MNDRGTQLRMGGENRAALISRSVRKARDSSPVVLDTTLVAVTFPFTSTVASTTTMPCALSRYVLIAGMVGILTSTVTGNEGAGWAAAAAAALVTYLAGRVFPDRVGSGTCEVPGAARRTGDADPIPRRADDRSGIDVT